MSSEAESPQIEETSAKTEKQSGGRRNPRRSTRNANPIKSEDSPEGRKPSRKGSSTESRSTRTNTRSTRSRKKSGSPTFRSSKGSAGGDENQESPAARVKSARRASSRVNYKESEGEEDALPELPKEEEDFDDDDDDWQDSEGDGKKRKETVRRTPAKSKKGTSTKDPKPRSRPSRTSNRQRTKKSQKEDEEADDSKDEKSNDEKELLDEEDKNKKSQDESKTSEGEENSMEVDNETTDNKIENEDVGESKLSGDEEISKDDPKTEINAEKAADSESNKRKLEDEEDENRKKSRIDAGPAKASETPYPRASNVIVENKQFSESSKETSSSIGNDSNRVQDKAVTDETKQNDISTEQGSHSTEPMPIGINGSSMLPKPAHSLPGSNGCGGERLYISNPGLGPERLELLRPRTFTLLSYNLQGPDGSLKENSLVGEVKIRNADLVCLQSVPPAFFADKVQPAVRELGYTEVVGDAGLMLLYKPQAFELVSNAPISLQALIKKDLEASQQPVEVVEAVSKHLAEVSCGAQVAELRRAGAPLLRLVNLSLPPQLEPACTTLLVARLVAELSPRPPAAQLLCGELNPVNWVAQLLSDGHLSSDLVQDMRRRKDIFLPNQEAISLVEVLPNLHTTSSSLQFINCYTTVLGSQKSSGGSEQVWASAGVTPLTTLGVWEPSLALQVSLAFSSLN